MITHLVTLGASYLYADPNTATIVELALQRKTGARGLRAIMESIMLEVMYTVPGQDNVQKIIITPEVVEDPKAFKIISKDSKNKKAS